MLFHPWYVEFFDPTYNWCLDPPCTFSKHDQICRCYINGSPKVFNRPFQWYYMYVYMYIYICLFVYNTYIYIYTVCIYRPPILGADSDTSQGLPKWELDCKKDVLCRWDLLLRVAPLYRLHLLVGVHSFVRCVICQLPLVAGKMLLGDMSSIVHHHFFHQLAIDLSIHFL